MAINRDALEIVCQTGGEMFDKRVFNISSLSPEIKWPDENIGYNNDPLTREKLEELSSALCNATKSCIHPYIDSKIGFTLSGGVDSSLLLYLIKKEFPDIDITAYHTDWKFVERSEQQFAEMAADLANVPLKIVDVSPSAQIPYLEDALAKSKVIAYSVVPVYMAHHAMAQDDIKIAVNALGLDELFAGYTIHKRYYSRGRFQFVPNIPRLASMKLYRGAGLKWGGNKTFLLANSVPTYSKQFIKDSSVCVSTLYDEKIESGNLWLDIHRWILTAMTDNYANLISRPALANGISVLYPFMDHALMTLTHGFSPMVKQNKAPIRTLMHDFYGFPEELSRRGAKWDKIGWGGTIAPYVQSKDYLNTLKPGKDESKEWFSEFGLKEYRKFRSPQPSITSFHMAMFLKILEVI